MRVHLNTEICDGHGECMLAAPGVFELADGEIVATLLRGEVDEPDRRRVLEAAGACPVRAITVED